MSTGTRGLTSRASAPRCTADAAARLYQSGNAYYCDCTREVIDARTKGNERPGYDGFCRDRGLEPGEGRALRFRTPREGSTTVIDLIRGEPVFDNALIEDFVLQRSNGTAMFILANVVDDIDMRISHVIRAEEHLPNTPKAILLWQALDGGPLPVFAHVPLLVNEKRQKLSKRRDPVALELYRDEGYLPETMQNFLMLLGWAPPDDREIMPFKELADLWRLEDVHSSPGVLRREEARGVQRRVHPGDVDGGVRRARAAVARAAARALASRAVRSPRRSRRWRHSCRRGSRGWSKCRRWWISCSSRN